jgi:hypothetical protein
MCDAAEPETGLAMVASRSTGKGEAASLPPRRPSRIPRPMPRKLANSRKFLKNPT